MKLPESRSPSLIRLTQRETQVLYYVAQGHSSMAVADALVVSRRTIDFHLANAYRKLDASNRISAILAARRLGLIPVEFANKLPLRYARRRRRLNSVESTTSS